MTPTRALSVHTTLDGREARLRLAGELDAEGSPLVRAQVDACLAAGSRALVVDLERLAFCDCSGLNLLLWARARCAGARVRFAVRHAGPQPLRLFALAGTTGLTDPGQGPAAAGSRLAS